MMSFVMPCRRCMSASSASGAFLLPGGQPLSPRHAGSSNQGISVSITQPASLLSGLAARLTSLARPAATATSAQPVEGSSNRSCNGSSPAASQPGKQLAMAEASPAAASANAGGGPAAAPAMLSLTEAGKQHAVQLVVSEVRLSTWSRLDSTLL